MKKSADTQSWNPLAPDKLSSICRIFSDLFPVSETGDLAERISEYWIHKLKKIWETKPDAIKQKDLAYHPGDPLSRIRQKSVVIAYADSVFEKGKTSLETLDQFMGHHFPAIAGLHILPACVVADSRFNDGYFSQIVRDKIHPAFGTNQQFADMMEKYFSMTDFVLNHVDIDNPKFQSYLNGNDAAGDCFFVFTEAEYQQRLSNGDFDQIFRPRPFPLFTIFRKTPTENRFARKNFSGRVNAMNKCLAPGRLPVEVIALLSIFNKIKNDQMLLENDYSCITQFIEYLEQHTTITLKSLFTLSKTQETRQTPYIFKEFIKTKKDLLIALGDDIETAQTYSAIFEENDALIFGEEIRALTTFSHVQVDLNTSTFKGLKMLADDFAWYLTMDLNMLRLDAANFAFKRWKTSCFGLPEVNLLMKILYLSMESVSPRIVANLEVNDKLSAVLKQMADRDAPPPMMYDFHLASILPVIFNTQNTDIATRIFDMIRQYEIPNQSIRFSIAETHDGKSVRGSLDLLTPSERMSLAQIVESNGGKIKSKGVPPRKYLKTEFQQVCFDACLDEEDAFLQLAKQNPSQSPTLHLKDHICDESDIAQALNISREQLQANDALTFFCNTVIHGREPYELCSSTRDALIRIDDPALEAKRFLAFYTIAFALMGRHVKSIYFNDLLGLANDYERMNQTGELRDIKRTKSDYALLKTKLSDPESFVHKTAKGINNLIALVDADPSLHFLGNEAELISTGNPAVACIHNHCGSHHTFVLINTSGQNETISFDLSKIDRALPKTLIDHFNHRPIDLKDEKLTLEPGPFQRLWLKEKMVVIPKEKLVE
ncbi:MAG: hypothetical protein HF978_01815 [Desulfobacteraceae bacterium]|nr:hypothetical protein [Desulfobacteraceae bacterium]MBC2754260.1 hypothetical protein [Desulfobacteraceae bacterium]